MTDFNCVVFRLVNISMSRTDYDKELGVVKEIARFNPFSDVIILKLIQKKNWVKNIRPASTLTNKGEQKIIRLSILYYPSISNALLKFSEMLVLP